MTPRATPTRAWGKRQWVRAVLAVIGLAVFAACSWMVLAPQLHHWEIRRGIGGWVCDRIDPPPIGFFSRAREHGDRRDASIVLLRDGTYYAPAWNSKRDIIEGLPAALARGERAWLIEIYQSQEDFGRWSATRRRMHAYLSDDEAVGPYDEDWDYAPPESSEAAIAMRKPAVEALQQRGLESARRGGLELIADGDWTGTFGLPSGYAINIATLLGLAMFLWCAPLTVRDAWRAWRFRGATACKSCGYDLRGLPDGAPACPECGSPRSARGGAGETSPAS
jgi:hypothetical protein